jgi:hypothetical protein
MEKPKYDSDLANTYRYISQCVDDYFANDISYETAENYLKSLSSIEVDVVALIGTKEPTYAWACKDYSANYHPSWC